MGGGREGGRRVSCGRKREESEKWEEGGRRVSCGRRKGGREESE